MEKTLTISIAAYNVEDYIRQTLDSLIDEKIIDDLEILVIDDGGTDGTLAIAQEYAERYPQSVFPIHKENGGYGSTINTGIERATGKYFKQLDGDDWYRTENLQALISTMKAVSVDCVLTDFIKCSERTGESAPITFYRYLEDGEYQVESSGIKDRLSMYMSAFRTTLLKDMPNRLTEHSFYTDVEYSALPIPYLNTIYVLHKVIYVYRTGEEGQSMSTAGIAKHYREHDAVFWRLCDIYRTIPEEKDVNRRIFRRLLEYRLKEHYWFLCMLPQRDLAKKEIRILNDRARKESPEILDILLGYSRRIRALVRFPRLAFPFCRQRVKKEWEEAGRLINS